jgi:RNA polymerase sigma-70 factor (ECF subfamily)
MIPAESAFAAQNDQPPAAGSPDACTSDSELIQRIGAGDLAPLGVLYDRHHESVRQFIARATAGGSDTDDLTHNTFLTLPSIASRFDGRSSARPLLIGIAVQLMRRRRRNVMRWAQTLGSFMWTSAQERQLTPEAAASGAEALHGFDRALSRLSEEKRLVFLLVEREGRSGEEVASALGIPVSTVWTRLHYARAELRDACRVPDRGGRHQEAHPGERAPRRARMSGGVLDPDAGRSP